MRVTSSSSYGTAVYEEVVISGPTIVVSSNTAHPGDTVEITVEILNSPQLYGMSFKVHFDDTSLELLSATSSGVFKYTKPAELKNGANFIWYANDPAESQGILLTMSFMVKDSASLGKYSINMTCNSGNTFDSNGDNIEINSVAGTIEVTD